MSTDKHDPWALLREARESVEQDFDDGEHLLPQDKDRFRLLLARIDAALAGRAEGSTKDVVESDEVKWVRVNPSEYRAIFGAVKVGVWKQYDKELWAWDRSKPYQCGEAKTEAEAKSAAIAAARGVR